MTYITEKLIEKSIEAFITAIEIYNSTFPPKKSAVQPISKGKLLI